MPYIKPDRRDDLNQEGGLGAFVDYLPLLTAGELNYVITRIVLQHILMKDEASYAHLNEVLGVLEAIKLELYRRYVAPYEDKKMKENGDVFLGAP